jgi:hypothetical protein
MKKTLLFVLALVAGAPMVVEAQANPQNLRQSDIAFVNRLLEARTCRLVGPAGEICTYRLPGLVFEVAMAHRSAGMGEVYVYEFQGDSDFGPRLTMGGACVLVSQRTPVSSAFIDRRTGAVRPWTEIGECGNE